MRRLRLSFARAAALAALSVAPLPVLPLRAAEFIRGDANGDGSVSIADAHRILSFIFHGSPPPDCLNAADANDDGYVDPGDAAYLVFFPAIPDAPPPPWPFPAPGADVTIDRHFDPECGSYGGGAPLEDPAAEIRVLDAVAPGGGSARAVITVAVSSSVPLAGLAGKIGLGGGVLAGVEEAMDDLTGTPSPGSLMASGLKLGFVKFGLVATPFYSDREVKWIPAGQSFSAARIHLTLKPGTPAGQYPLSLLEGELADWGTARAIRPVLTGGTLTVETDVGSRPIPPRPDPTPDMFFKLGTVSGVPGGTAQVPFSIQAPKRIAGFAFSVDFDEEVLQVERVEQVWQRPDGADYGFKVYEFNNQNDVPGSAGVDEGFVIGAAALDIASHQDEEDAMYMPAGLENLALIFHFRINPEAPAGSSTAVMFLDGGQGSGWPVGNILTAEGESHAPILMDSSVLLDGRINILDDIATFIRGDSNGDGALDVSDPQTTLSYLFLGGRPPFCYDASDHNDDGGIDITDAVSELEYLFLDGLPPAPPFPDAGQDLTEDSMGCLLRR